jgi:rhodanese-related sulfurtransferase
VARRGWAYSTDEAKGLVGRSVVLIDLREKAERDRAGTIPGSVHAPYADLQDNIDDGGLIHELAMPAQQAGRFHSSRSSDAHRQAALRARLDA